MSDSIPVTLGSGGRLEDVIGKLDLAVGINPAADVAYHLLKKHPEKISHFGIEYIEHTDGRCELIGISMITNKGSKE